MAFLPRLVIKDGSWFSGKWVPYPVGLFRTFIIFLVRGFMPHIVIQGVSYSLASGVHTPMCSSACFMFPGEWGAPSAPDLLGIVSVVDLVPT